MKHICNPNCIYYPNEFTEIIKEYIDKNGVKRREAVYICSYDEHRITNWESCDNFKLYGGENN